MTSLKYARVERERRFLVAGIPDRVSDVRTITDRYVVGTRLRLREVVEADGSVTRKLTQKVRLTEGPHEVACTNFYLDDGEWELLQDLASHELRKTRHMVRRDGVVVAVDEFPDGTLLAEIDAGDAEPVQAPAWLDVIEDVTHREEWSGAALAERWDIADK